MTQLEMQAKVADAAQISKAAAGRIIELIGRLIVADLLLDGRSVYPGLGIFTVRTQVARTFTPPVGAPVEKPARKTVKFKLSARVKKQIQGA